MKNLLVLFMLVVALIGGASFVAATASSTHHRQPAAVAKATHNYVIAYVRCPKSKAFHPSWVQELSTQRATFRQWRYVGQDRKQIQGFIHTAKLYGRNGILIDKVSIPCK